MNPRLNQLIQFSAANKKGAVFFDFDHVLHHPKLTDSANKHAYLVDDRGMLCGELYDKSLLQKLFQLLKSENYAIYVVTARPETHRNYIHGLLSEICDIQIEDIRCLGVERYDEVLKRPHVDKLKHLKVEEIKQIHQTELPYLSKSEICFTDDDKHNIDPVKDEGYVTFLAKALLDEAHLHQICDFVSAKKSLNYLVTLGNYAVLETQADLATKKLDRTEFAIPAEQKELDGQLWRLRKVIDFASEARYCLQNPKDKLARFKQLQVVTQFESQAIFFTQQESLIEQHIQAKSLGTASSLAELAKNDFIILLGSEGKRKAGPLQKVLAQVKSRKIAIIGLPAESGVDTQPSSHAQTYLGAQNRLEQLRLFRQNLTEILQQKGNVPEILCLAIENGIDALPMSSSAPLQTPDQSQYCFADQAHILLDDGLTTHYHVAKPTQLSYTLVHNDAQSLIAMSQDPIRYYQTQSQWSQEMMKRFADPSLGSPFPVRVEQDVTYTSDDLIQETLQIIVEGLLVQEKLIAWLKDQRLITEGNIKTALELAPMLWPLLSVMKFKGAHLVENQKNIQELFDLCVRFVRQSSAETHRTLNQFAGAAPEEKSVVRVLYNENREELEKQWLEQHAIERNAFIEKGNQEAKHMTDSSFPISSLKKVVNLNDRLLVEYDGKREPGNGWIVLDEFFTNQDVDMVSSLRPLLSFPDEHVATLNAQQRFQLVYALMRTRTALGSGIIYVKRVPSPDQIPSPPQRLVDIKTESEQLSQELLGERANFIFAVFDSQLFNHKVVEIFFKFPIERAADAKNAITLLRGYPGKMQEDDFDVLWKYGSKPEDFAQNGYAKKICDGLDWLRLLGINSFANRELVGEHAGNLGGLLLIQSAVGSRWRPFNPESWPEPIRTVRYQLAQFLLDDHIARIKRELSQPTQEVRLSSMMQSLRSPVCHVGVARDSKAEVKSDDSKDKKASPCCRIL